MKGQYGLLAISQSHYTILSYATVNTIQPAWSTQKGWSRQGLSPQALVGVPARGEGHSQVRTVGMRAANMRKSMEKNRKPELLRTFLASFPMPRYSRPMRRPIPMCEVIRRCVRT